LTRFAAPHWVIGMTAYDDSMTMGDARRRYFDDNGFDGSYSERWVKLKAGPIPLYFPNAEGRRRAVKLHDLHHIVTGYQTTWTGESEIGAWEIASGCGRFAWAWGLNLSALAIGLFVAPRAAFKAFVRGRHTANLYRHAEFRDAILGRSVGDMRSDLRLDQPAPPAGISDMVAFGAWSVAALALQFWPLAVLIYVLG
jgi:hypothetical protein